MLEAIVLIVDFWERFVPRPKSCYPKMCNSKNCYYTICADKRYVDHIVNRIKYFFKEVSKFIAIKIQRKQSLLVDNHACKFFCNCMKHGPAELKIVPKYLV